MSRRITLIIGAALAIIAVVLVKVYLDQQGDAAWRRAQREMQMVQEQSATLIVATTDIVPGAAIEPGMLQTVQVPRTQAPQGAVTSLAQIAGRIAKVPIPRGSPILADQIVASQQRVAAAASLAVATPIGKRAIAVDVGEIESVGRMIQPGDHIDILCRLPVPVEGDTKKKKTEEIIFPLFQNVLILSVGAEMVMDETGRYAPRPEPPGQQKPRRGGNDNIVTLALAPEEANLMAFVHEQGEIQFILRSPKDAEVIDDIAPATFEALVNLALPGRMDTGPAPVFAGPKQPTKTIEIYRGLNREEVPIY
ncbi:Flp pilus assembly protein CpaB [Candidatus Omnitrophota bacterium]